MGGTSQNTQSGIVLGATLVGAVAGGLLISSPQVGALVGGSIAQLVIGLTTPTDPGQRFTQESIGSFAISPPELGKAIPRLIGEGLVAGTPIWLGPIDEHLHEIESSGVQSGKGGAGSSAPNITERRTYSFNAVYAFAEGPVFNFDEILFDQDVYFDRSQPGDWRLLTPEDTGEPEVFGIEHPDAIQRVLFYPGTETQNVPALIELHDGIGSSSASRGTCLMAFENIDIGTLGRIPFITARLRSNSLPTGQPISIFIDSSVTISKVWVAYSTSVFRTGEGAASIASLDGDALTPLSLFYGGVNVVAASQGSAVLDNISNLSIPTIVLANGSDDSLSAYLLATGAVVEGQENIPLLTQQETIDGVIGDVRDVLHDLRGRYVAALYALDSLRYISTSPGALETIVPGIEKPIRLIGIGESSVHWVISEAGFVYAMNNLNIPSIQNTFGAPGNDPADLILAASEIWIAMRGIDQVWRIADRTGANPATVIIPVGASPTALAVADDGYIWVAHRDGNFLTRIDPVTNLPSVFPQVAPTTVLTPGTSGRMVALSDVSNQALLVDSTGAVVDDQPILTGVFKAVDTGDGVSYILAARPAGVFRLQDINGTLDVLTPGDSNSLACVIKDMSIASGLGAERVDVSGLDNLPVHMISTDVASVRPALQELINIYSIFPVESGGIVRWYYHGGETWAQLPQEALGVGPGRAAPQSDIITRLDDQEMPARATVRYRSPARTFEPSAQSVNYADHPVPTHLKVNTFLSLTDQQARDAAEVQLWEPHIGREGHQVTLLPRMLALDPGDMVEMSTRGITYLTQIIDIQADEGLILSVQSRDFRPYIYEGFLGAPGGSPTGEIRLPQLVDAATAIVDGAPLDFEDSGLRIFDALHQVASGDWQGAVLSRSDDGGATYFPIDSTVSSAAVGIVEGVIPSPPAPLLHTVWDNTTVIRVRMRQGVLTPTTDSGVLVQRLNQAYVGSGDKFEVIHYVNAVLVDVDLYDLSRLLRGRRGTEDLLGTHLDGDFFIPVTGSLRNHTIAYPTALLDISRDYKVTSPSQTLSQAVSEAHTLTGRCWRPWMPTAVAATQNANDWIIAWIERGRYQTKLLGITGVLRDPDLQHWRLRIYLDGTYTTIARTVIAPLNTLTTMEHTYIYTEAEQIVDFGIAQTVVYYDIAGITTLREGIVAQGTTA